MKRLLPIVISSVAACSLAIPLGMADDSILNQVAPQSAADFPTMFDLYDIALKRAEPVPTDFENFLRNSRLNLHLRNFYFDRTKPDALDSYAWAQGGWLTYESGKLAGVFSLGLEYAASFPLWAPEDHGGTLLLEPVQDEIDVLTVANPRFDLDGNIVSLYRQKYDLPYVNQQDNRMIPNTFEGYTIAMPKTANENFQYVAGYIDKMKKRDSDHYVSMSDAAGISENETGLFLGGLRFFPEKDWSIAAINYYTQDYLNMSYFESSYKHPITDEVGNNISVQYSDQRSVGDDLLRGDSYTSNFWGIQDAISYQHAVVRAAFNQTDSGAFMQSPFGSYPGYTASIVEDFNNAGEASWLLGISYDFGRIGLKDLSLSASYISGSGSIDEVTKASITNKDETDVNLDYKVSEGTLKGFWLRLRSATVNPEQGENTQDYRIILNYDFLLYEPEPPAAQ